MPLPASTHERLEQLLDSEEHVVGFSEDLHDDSTVHVYVDEMDGAAALPGTLDGHPVEYRAIGRLTTQAPVDVPAIVGVDPRTKVRPLVGGISISPKDASFSGTLGYFAKARGDQRVGLLTCEHVLPASKSADVVQPSIEDGGSPSDVVARRHQAVNNDVVDCAFAPLNDTKYTAEINHLGRVAGARAAVRNEPVRKSGRTTTLTSGKVEDPSATLHIDGKTYREQVLVRADAVPFSAGGDSGSLVVATSDERAVALLFAGDGTFAAACKIANVQAALAVDLI